jgi:hypothetical protein
MHQEKLLAIQQGLTSEFVTMINCAYYVREHHNFEKYKSILMSKGLKTIAHSGEGQFAPDRNKLKVAIFTKEEEPQKLYIALAGTYDSIDYLHSTQVILKDKTFGHTIPKAASLKTFLTAHMDSISKDHQKIVLLGHSFGGLLSQYAALELNSRGIHDLECYNFSPLNSQKIISRLIYAHNRDPEKSKYFSGKEKIDIDYAQFTNLVRPDDLVVSRGNHLGYVHYVSHCTEEEPTGCWKAFKIHLIGNADSHALDSYGYVDEPI